MAASKKETEPAESPPNGVAVVVDDDGRLQVQTLGETRVTEAPTILRIAANSVEKNLIEQS